MSSGLLKEGYITTLWLFLLGSSIHSKLMRTTAQSLFGGSARSGPCTSLLGLLNGLYK